ncbi:hypothetical protein [Vibrio nigripulchritudo]|uniref:hypothetical protein n=1 Tax=Vibrio nigripulchritudo TaxID=28173 RepID=UPI0003B20925|nr:hypothetical protein [Vibrio nigripulchritudo]CCN69759.1 hypothetical protein VIBNISFn118_150013 [Vibrio nigripulchritudo SFn118]
MTDIPHSREAIERELEACESAPEDSHFQGAADALMWVLGKTPPPSTDIPDTP